MKIYTLLAVMFLGLAAVGPIRAQYLPVVFDRQYSDASQFGKLCSMAGDEVVMAGQQNGKMVLVWLDREGNPVLSRPMDGFTGINAVVPAGDDQVLVVGQARVPGDKSHRHPELTGCAAIISRDGRVKSSVYVGNSGSSLLNGRLLGNGALLLGGYETKGAAKVGMIAKVSRLGQVLYKYNPAAGAECSAFDVQGSTAEYIYAAFSAEADDAPASIVRLDDKGKPYYILQFPALGFHISEMASTSDGSVFVTGSSVNGGGVVYKVRPEGDVVFAKTIVPVSTGADVNHLFVAHNGNVLVGGSGGDRGYYALLRNDGTTLQNGTFAGLLSGAGMEQGTGESVVISYDPATRLGSFVRISAAGKPEFEKNIDGQFDAIRINSRGEVLLASTGEGRVSLYSAFGERLSDRFVNENKPAAFSESLLTPSGEVLFLGMDNRLVKAGHGLYISDVKINKPINGYATALFTVTLSGYSTTKEGAPIPVSVKYGTRAMSATEVNNFTPVSGTLSFIPANDDANRYLINQYIEVPIKANDLIEGSKEFRLALSDARQSYLIKPVGTGLIEDQQAVVKQVRVDDGLEASKDVTYELGLFKTSGTPLTNATGSVIIVDGRYGEGTADALDFDMGLTPRLLIPNGQHAATFNVRTLSDTRYELPKSVVVDFNKIHALSTSNVAFDGALLSCTGNIIDQSATVTIASLGDHGRRNNNVVSGFFSISLRRASDGALLTNATGNDIMVTCSPVTGSTAKEGSDYVFTNLHNLRIGGDSRQSAVNLSGIVLYSADPAEKQLSVAVDSISSPAGAPTIRTVPEAKQSGFAIKD